MSNDDVVLLPYLLTCYLLFSSIQPHPSKQS
jgi:hypothetical protein